MLIVVVLGSIFAGIATPTESSGSAWRCNLAFDPVSQVLVAPAV